MSLAQQKRRVLFHTRFELKPQKQRGTLARIQHTLLKLLGAETQKHGEFCSRTTLSIHSYHVKFFFFDLVT